MLVEIWLAVVAVVLALLWYSKHRHNYWASKGIPTAPHLPLIGNLHEGFVRPLWESTDKTYKYHGGSKFCGRYEGFRPALLIGDPDILREVLVKDFDHFVDRRTFGDQKDSLLTEMLSNKTGDEWKVLRSIMSPTFSSGKMKSMFPLVCKNGDTLISSCLRDAAKNPAIDMKDKFGRFTMDTIASCAFGIESNSLEKEKPEFTQKAETFFSMTPLKFLKFMLMMIFPKVYDALGFKVDGPEVKFFSDVVKMTIASREAAQQRGDFLDLMLEARAEDGGSNSTTSAKHVLADRTIVAQCTMFLIAGYDTTASTLAIASHLLAQNPKEQERLREELQELVGQEGELTYHGVMEAKFLDACIQETLRIYPPGAIGERICTKPYKVPGTDVVLRVGDLIQFPIWSIHRDPRYWPEPLKFRPDRFMPENKANIKHFTHMPFGMGPRNCIAMRFALMEVKVALAKLVLAAELEVAKGYEEIQIERFAFLVRPQDGCKVLVKPLREE